MGVEHELVGAIGDMVGAIDGMAGAGHDMVGAVDDMAAVGAGRVLEGNCDAQVAVLLLKMQAAKESGRAAQGQGGCCQWMSESLGVRVGCCTGCKEA